MQHSLTNLSDPYVWLMILLYGIITPFCFYWVVIRRRRSKPEGYVGKFRRRDGRIVHVMRDESGRLWAASEEAPGVMPEHLGYVNGREISQWHKLATTPDGQDCIPRPY